ncbi:MAG: metallophosphatase, partial [Lentisphaerae bacterium]|nr:metallophosphatase [Lentisphaerota bacterium]
LIPILFFSAVPGSAGELKKITILETSDIHSQVDSDSKPGLLRLSAALDSERKKAGGGDSCLIIDCGDILQGSRQGSLSNGELGVKFLNELKYDAWVPGNHDFDFGSERILKVFSETEAADVAANLYFDNKRMTLPWKVFVKNGVRIAVIGMTTPYLDKWHWGNRAKGFSSIGISEALDEIMPEVMAAKSDMIVLAVHQGIFQGDKSDFNISRIASKYPQIDLILGAHTHQEAPGETVGVLSWYVQAGSYGSSIARIEAEVDVEKHKTVKIESKMISVSACSPDSFRVSDEFQDIISSAAKSPGKSIAFFKDEIASDEFNRLTASAFINSAADISSAMLILQGNGIRQGNFSEDDLFWIFQFEDTVCLIDLDEEETRTVIDEASKLKDDVKVAFFKNEKIGEKSGRRTIATSSYALAGAGGRIKTLANFAKNPDCRATDTGITLRDAFRNYLLSQK